MKKLACLCVFVAVHTAGATTIYTNEGGFLTAVAPNYYLEDFDTLVGGGPWAAPGANGYGFTAYADFGLFVHGSGVPTPPALSVGLPDDTLLITFTGLPVTALGGWFSTVSNGGNQQMNVITLSDGTVEQFIGTGFRGFVSDVPIASFTFFGSDDPSYTRQWLDHLYVGRAVPEPATLALLVLGGLFLRRR